MLSLSLEIWSSVVHCHRHRRCEPPSSVDFRRVFEKKKTPNESLASPRSESCLVLFRIEAYDHRSRPKVSGEKNKIFSSSVFFVWFSIDVGWVCLVFCLCLVSERTEVVSRVHLWSEMGKNGRGDPGYVCEGFCRGFWVGFWRGGSKVVRWRASGQVGV